MTYRVSVEAAGFKKKIIEDVKVDTASVATVNVTMETGSVDTQVTVTAEAAMLNTESGTTSSTFTANYTYAKSIDDASSSGGDKNVLSGVGGFTDGQAAFGASRSNDRSVSTFDQRHVINGTYIWDVPIGRGRQWANHLWRPLDYLAGGWTTSGTIKFNSGFPYMPYLSDANQLGDITHTARPDLIPGVPVVNPMWDRNCPTGTGCQPYVNPSAFARPALGALGTAPRTLDGVRGPWAQWFNMSVQKDFYLGEGRRRRLQFRADALNALNHPVFAVYPNNAGGADFMGAPSTAALNATDYNTWATANGQPLAATTPGRRNSRRSTRW